MKGMWSGTVLAIAAAVASAGDVPPPAPPPDPLRGDLPFLASFEEGRAEAAWRGKPMLVFFCLKEEEASLRVADCCFRDAAVVARASAFVPILVDADAEERFGLEHGVRTVPTILLIDLKGREAGRAEGAAGPAEVLRSLDEALNRIGSPRPPKQARDLAKAAAALEQALLQGEWKGVLKAAAAIEAIGHPGPELAAAAKAREAAVEEAAKRLAAAKKLLKDGKRDEARAAFRRIVRDFPGLDAAVEARNLVKEMDGPDGPDDGGGGSGGSSKRKPPNRGRSHPRGE